MWPIRARLSTPRPELESSCDIPVLLRLLMSLSDWSVTATGNWFPPDLETDGPFVPAR